MKNKYTFLLSLYNNSSCNGTLPVIPDDNDDSDNGETIDFTSKNMVIFYLSASAIFLLVFSFFIYLERRRNQERQMLVNVLVHKKDAYSLGDHLSVPMLDFEKDLTSIDHLHITNLGLMEYVNREIQKIVAERVKEDEPIERKRHSNLQKVLKTFLSDIEEVKIDSKHDVPLSIMVRYFPQRKYCNFFERSLLPITRTTIFFELTFGVVQTLGSLETGPNPFHLPSKTQSIISITQVSLNYIFMLLMTFASPSQAFLPDFGHSMDKIFHRYFNHRKADPVELNPEQENVQLSFKTRATILIDKMFLLIFLVNTIYSQVIGDYITAAGTSTKINDQGSSMLPPWFMYLCIMIEFGLNQLNDPVELISGVYLGFNLIDMYFLSKFAAVKKESCHTEKLEVVVDDLITDGINQAHKASIEHLQTSTKTTPLLSSSSKAGLKNNSLLASNSFPSYASATKTLVGGYQPVRSP